MPQYNEYTSASAQDTDDGDLILWEIDGVTHKMTSDEFRKVNNIAVVNSQTGTSYTLVIGDLGKTIDMNNASANTLTVPPSSDVDFPINTQIAVWRMGAGSTTIVAGSGVTINTANDDLAIAAQYTCGILRKVAADTWVWAGGGTASSSIPQLSTPASLTMTADGENDMDFAWDDVANESGFEVQIAEDAGFTTGVQTANKGVGVLTHSFSGLTAGTTYYGRVKAEGDGTTYSDSGYAEDSADTDVPGLIALNDPTGFSATVDGSDVDLVWTDTNTSPNEVGYEILRNSTNTTVGATLINTTAANATSYTDTAPGAGTWYYFVRAKGNLTTTGHSAYVSDSVTIAGGVTIDTFDWLQDFDVDASDTEIDTGKVKWVVDRQNSAGSQPTDYALKNLGASQPDYVAGGINGFDAIHLQDVKTLATNAFPSGPLTAPFEIHAIIDVQAVEGATTEFIVGVGGASQEHYIVKHSSGNLATYSGAYLTSATTLTTGKKYLRYVRRGGSDDELFLNGVSIANGNAGAQGDLTILAVGGLSQVLDCYMTRLCTCNGEISSGDAADILASVLTKYAITP